MRIAAQARKRCSCRAIEDMVSLGHGIWNNDIGQTQALLVTQSASMRLAFRSQFTAERAIRHLHVSKLNWFCVQEQNTLFELIMPKVE